MSKTTWIVVGAAAALVLLKMKQQAPAPAAENVNLSGVEGSNLAGPLVWQGDRPVDATIAPTTQRGDGTNPIGSWLQRTFGLSLPTIQPAYLANASAPAVGNVPATPAGSWEGGNLGMAAVPGTWPAATSEPVPAGTLDFSDPNLLLSVMIIGDEAVYVPDPVLF